MQRKRGCANGFCNGTDGSCHCLANYDPAAEGAEGSAGSCARPRAPRNMSFYMYRAQDNTTYDLANDNLGSLSGVMWYLHNEVVVQSCPRLNNITSVRRVLVTVLNPEVVFSERKSLFGPFADFNDQGCHSCVEDVFSKYGYNVGCQFPASAEHYEWAGYKPSWYSLPGQCPSLPTAKKTAKCREDEPGGQCGTPTGNASCTWTYADAGSVEVEELYGPDFDYAGYCAKLGGSGVPGEYDRNTDSGKFGVSFWDGKLDGQRNAHRTEALRALFQAKYPEEPELPEPSCDWDSTPEQQQPLARAAVVV